ncbi:hypothetical protein HET69_28515 [Streptomyces sp. CJ_13]|uniref:hypothetical protein n=1 Tax=Streptomyces sp. CJ_13 TaxID=2724943 RepID=UPI001BDDB422|nr:hypothetical protein [Streptomyces sp. CJ_13]MBT1187824.1 hypothetical protein [Streptomyces sp. CJ_13]
MPGSDKPESDGTEDDGAPRVRGESRSTVRDVLLALVGQAFLADLSDEAAYWIRQGVVWLFDMIGSYL